MIGFLIFVAVFLSVIIGGMLAGTRTARSKWGVNLKEFNCPSCKVGYNDSRAFAWHVRGQHPETFDGWN